MVPYTVMCHRRLLKISKLMILKVYLILIVKNDIKRTIKKRKRERERERLIQKKPDL
jgi:hypothetical protein